MSKPYLVLDHIGFSVDNLDNSIEFYTKLLEINPTMRRFYEEDYVGYQDTLECVECILGDINNDSLLDVLDIVSMINLILDGEYDECGDVNSDGTINVQDVVIFVNIILSIP